MLKTILDLEEVNSGYKNKFWNLIQSKLLMKAKYNRSFRHFFWALQKHSAIQRNVALYGGAVRDFLFGLEPKDLDLVYYNNSSRPNEEIIKEVLRFALKDFVPNSNIKLSRNKYGSLVLDLHGLLIDLWEVKDCWIFQQDKFENKEKSFQNILDLSPLSSDMVMFLFDGTMIVDDNFKDTLNYGVLIKNNDLVSDNEYNAKRAAKICYKYDFKPDHQLKSYIENKLNMGNYNDYNWTKDPIRILKTIKKSSNFGDATSSELHVSSNYGKHEEIDVMKYLDLKKSYFIDELEF